MAPAQPLRRSFVPLRGNTPFPGGPQSAAEGLYGGLALSPACFGMDRTDFGAMRICRGSGSDRSAEMATSRRTRYDAPRGSPAGEA
jgi:hypothetical protein